MSSLGRSWPDWGWPHPFLLATLANFPPDMPTAVIFHDTPIAETIAARGTVFLKNEDILPLDDDTDVSVLGPSVRDANTGGGGSSELEPLHEVAAADGIRERTTVERGVPEIEQISFFGGNKDDEDDAEPDPSLDAAVDAAANTEVAIVVVQDAATEAKDRESLRLPGRQDELVEEVAAVNDDTVVVPSSGPVEMPWKDDVSAVLESRYPGQSDGNALASVLFGDVDAGGRLPVTFAGSTRLTARSVGGNCYATPITHSTQ